MKPHSKILVQFADEGSVLQYHNYLMIAILKVCSKIDKNIKGMKYSLVNHNMNWWMIKMKQAEKILKIIPQIQITVTKEAIVDSLEEIESVQLLGVIEDIQQ